MSTAAATFVDISRARRWRAFDWQLLLYLVLLIAFGAGDGLLGQLPGDRGRRRALPDGEDADLGRHRPDPLLRRGEHRLSLAADLRDADLPRGAGPPRRHGADRDEPVRRPDVDHRRRARLPVQRDQQGADDRGAGDLPRVARRSDRSAEHDRGCRAADGGADLPRLPPAGPGDGARLRGDPARHALHERGERRLAGAPRRWRGRTGAGRRRSAAGVPAPAALLLRESLDRPAGGLLPAGAGAQRGGIRRTAGARA